MNKLSSILQIIVFSAFISLFFLLNLAVPDLRFSPQENRYLAMPPKITADALFQGQFTSDFEAYVTDQFVARDAWISMKSMTERALGKQENNNVFFCGQDTLIERFSAPDPTLVQDNIQAINTLAANADVPVTFSLIPGAVSIWKDRLPKNADNCDQKALIDEIYAQIETAVVDTFGSLYEHRSEPIYYRTDHHWTSLGAYWGYSALGSVLHFHPDSLDSFTPETVSDAFYGTVYSSSGVRWIMPDSIQVYVPEEGVEVLNYNTGTPAAGTLYNDSFLQKKDKYAFFLGGNSPLITLKTEHLDAPRLLVLRDSYFDALAPFLLAHYSEIHLIDLRYYRFSVQDFIEENGIDEVLVSYSVANFTSDTSIFMAGN